MKPKSTLRSFLVLAGSTLLAISSASAQLYWDSNGATPGFGTANGTWGTSTFWSTDSTGASATANTTITASDDVNFGTASAGYTGGRAVTISGTQTFNSMTIGSASGAVTFSGGTALDLGNANTVITQNSASATTISTVIGGGTNGLTKAGSGRLILTGGNTYTGNTVVDAGILRFGSTWSNSWSTGTRSLNVDSNLEINNGIVEAYYFATRALGADAGEIQLTGGRAGFTNLQGDNSGNPFVTFGDLATTVTWGPGAFNPTTFVMNDVGAASVMRFANPFDFNGTPRAIEVAATGAGGASNNGRGTYGTMEGALSGAGGSLIKIGPGTLMLNGTNDYDGGTTINAGGVWFDKLVAMPASGTVTVNEGGILSVSVGNTGGWTTGASGVGTIGGLLLPTGDGGQTAAQVSYNGNVNLGFNITGTQTYSDAIGNVGTSLGIHVGNKDSGSAADPFTAAGTLTLSGNNSYTGATWVNRGTLSIGSIANAGSNSVIGNFASAGASGLILNGGTFSYTGSTASTNRGFTLNAASTINVPTAGETLTMGDSTINSIGALTVNGGTGSSLALGTVSQNASWALTNTNAVSISSISVGSGGLNFSPTTQSTTVGSISGTNLSYIIGGAGGGEITGVIALGTGGLTKAGGGLWTISGSNNSYTGATNINAGTLEFDTIGNVSGGNSSLGAPTTVANGTIGLGNSTATTNTLRYLGSGTVSTDRVINLRNTTGVAILDMSGTGTLTFTSNLTATAGASKTFTLTGSTSGVGVIGGAIPNNSGTNITSLAKTGTGTWVLGGANSYTGATTISDGTLRLGANDVIPNAITSTVSIGAATLDAATFTDTLGTLNVTAAATINLGAGASLTFADSSAVDWTDGTLAITGTFVSGDGTEIGNPGSLRFGTDNAGLSATQLGEIAAPGWISFGLDAYGYLTAIPDGGNSAPTISDIIDQSVPSGGNTGALAFTVGDTETDAGSLSLSVSGNTNTGLVPNGNIVFGGSGANRTVTVTPVSGSVGTATITIRVTDDGALFAEDSFTLTVTDNYLSWSTANGVTGGINGDHDSDGVSNLVEYALVNGVERGVLSGNTITFTKRGAPYGSDLSYIIETSETLGSGSWTDAVTHGPELLVSNPTISYTFTPSSPVKKFARLKVVQVP